jgi:hypothetical protein
MDAILVDDSEMLRDLLAKVRDVNGRFEITKFHLPPLLEPRPPWAALSVFFGAASCFHIFTMLAFDNQRINHHNRSLGHFAAAGDDMAIVRELSTLGQTFTVSDFEYNTPIHDACQMRKRDVVNWPGRTVLISML